MLERSQLDQAIDQIHALYAALSTVLASGLTDETRGFAEEILRDARPFLDAQERST
ncbi:hypothetical protein CupriaWKF_22190 [Cupriavidus sp. WKF15]|uniref:hypothetical protein n=1 Tax=Cupriavidus sp. WKF15 TaxID=3032282 RepID=UPI0023E34154|nr:hypothetical protein [Cupriavidus sp. WKF15]WER49836.1 hypothetical protein CupriaWKF_22190 [Cupriavidus sp. WKF15]